MFWKSFYEDNIQPEIQVPPGAFSKLEGSGARRGGGGAEGESPLKVSKQMGKFNNAGYFHASKLGLLKL